MTEIIFLVEELPDGGFTARALDTSIVTEGDDLQQVRVNVRDAVVCHFDVGKAPKIIRLHFVRDEIITV